jgi:hypothetical protein
MAVVTHHRSHTHEQLHVSRATSGDPQCGSWAPWRSNYRGSLVPSGALWQYPWYLFLQLASPCHELDVGSYETHLIKLGLHLYNQNLRVKDITRQKKYIPIKFIKFEYLKT